MLVLVGGKMASHLHDAWIAAISLQNDMGELSNIDCDFSHFSALPS